MSLIGQNGSTEVSQVSCIIGTEKNRFGEKSYKEMNNPFDLPSQSTEVCLLPAFTSVSIAEGLDNRMDAKDHAHTSKGA